MVNDGSYTEMGIWELAARHTVARDHRNYPLCSLIEQEVKKRSDDQQQLIKKLKYYSPTTEDYGTKFTHTMD